MGLVARALVFLSFVSIPGAEELGLITLTQLYIACVIATPAIATLIFPTKPLASTTPPGLTSLLLFLATAATLLINQSVAAASGVDTLTWLSRAVHITLVPFYYIIFKLSKRTPTQLLQDLYVVGIAEAFLIYAALFSYFPSEGMRRAADFGGAIIYSVFMVVAAHQSLQRLARSTRTIHLLSYFFILLAAILTGTRVLIFSILVLAPQLRLTRKQLYITATSIAFFSSTLYALGAFDRFNLTDPENVITVSSKIEEIVVLWQYFTENPIFGAGLGRAYQVELAATEYTYSHNIVLFYLGYTGILGFLIYLFPLLRMTVAPGYRLLMMAIFVFYTSSTTFTNVKHSILCATLLLLTEQLQRETPTPAPVAASSDLNLSPPNCEYPPNLRDAPGGEPLCTTTGVKN